MSSRAPGTTAGLSDRLRTPWSDRLSAPALPVQCRAPIDVGVAAPTTTALTTTAGGPLRLDVPWHGAEIVLPARADALPGAALPVPAPRATLDLRDRVASLV